MQLKKTYTLSKITAITLITSQITLAENYVSVAYLQYDEKNDRVSVSAPSLAISYDIGTDYNIKLDAVHDAVTGATPIWQSDTISGASARDNAGDYTYKNADFDEGRNAGSLMLTTRLANRDELYTGIDYSRESDFDSKAASIEYMHYTDNSHNQSFNIGISYAYNEILTYDYDTGSGASHKEESTSFNIQAGITQILSAFSTLKLEAFTIIDDGYLTNPYSNVIRNYGTESQRLTTEHRPDARTAYGLNFKFNTLLSENISYKLNYRYYRDDWDIDSQTIDNQIYYEVNNDIILGIGLRYYTQSKASFYNQHKDFFTSQTYASSDQRLSKFDAFTYKASINYKYNEQISYNLETQFYTQSTGLDATTLIVGIKYRF